MKRTNFYLRTDELQSNTPSSDFFLSDLLLRLCLETLLVQSQQTEVADYSSVVLGAPELWGSLLLILTKKTDTVSKQIRPL